MNAAEAPPVDRSESAESPESTLIVIETDGADFCAVDGSGC